jgi:SAM-dependent methyltransferase
VWLAGDAAARTSLGEVARKRASEFTWDGAVDDFLKAAEAAIDEARSPARRASLAAAPTGVASNDSAGRAGATSAPLIEVEVEVAGDTVGDSAAAVSGLARSVHLFKLFRREPVDPDTFYKFLAADTIRQLRRYTTLEGAVAVDIGGGPGYTAEALKGEGARCCVVEYSHDELLLHDRQPDVAVQGDGQALPVATGSVRLAHSSNVLEHVPDPFAMLSEMARVIEPGVGVGYLTFTNWLSPWGGHETSPWHYLGGERAVRRFTARHGRPPKNRYGESLFPLHIGEVLRWFADRPDLEALWVGPRYLPDWARWVVRVPGVREVATWNLVVVFRRRPGPSDPAGRATGQATGRVTGKATGLRAGPTAETKARS